jgi:hypothetical protein
MNDMELPILESLYDSQGRNDALITLLVELCHLLSACLRRDHDAAANPGGDSDSIEETIDVPMQIDPYAQLAKTLEKLNKRSGHDGTLLIRACRLSSHNGSGSHPDYQVFFSDIVMDRETVAMMIRRVGEHMTYLNALISKAFTTFDNHNVLTLHLKLPDDSQYAFMRLRTSISIIARYRRALNKAEDIEVSIDNDIIKLPLMKDEKGLPDPNLTMLAGLNAIQPEAMKTLVKEVCNWIKESDTSTGAHRYAGVYDAIAGIKNLRQKLILPPIELNNIRWLLLDRSIGKLPKAKAQVARLVDEEFENTSADQALYLESLYGRDYHRVSARELGLRLKRISELIEAIGDRPKKDMINEEILSNVQWRMEKVPDDIIRQLRLENGILAIHEGREIFTIGHVHDFAARIIDFYTGRLDTREKMRRIGRKENAFAARDYEILSRDFDISPMDVKEILHLLQGCFDTEGRFSKIGFEDRVSEFSRYEAKVFEILWHFLKQPMQRDDRIAFLNALQLLFVQMKTPEKALKVLLGDFLEEPDAVRFSDRNALMLANLLLRRYNKELDIDIEITPEEVFLVKEGLNRDAATASLMLIDAENEALFEKIRTIHRKVVIALDSGYDSVDDMNLKYLLSLEREIHVFVALLGGDVARSIIRSAINEYGNPDAEIYRLADDTAIIEAFLQHLKVLVRGLGRSGEPSDEWVIDKVIDRHDEFLSFSKESRHEVLVNRVLEWAGRAKEEIQSRRVTEVA